jgi:8-hydroxy-5-deazaflavin:NADPH oxidoreductase
MEGRGARETPVARRLDATPLPAGQEKRMRIAILGAGNVGGALARALAKKNHAIVLGVRDPLASRYKELAESIGHGTEVRGLREAAAAAEVVVLATPWSATQAVLEQAAGVLQGKIVLDATNPITPGFKLALGQTTSGGEMIAAWAKGAFVYKAFNITGYNIMEDPLVDGRQAMMLVAGDNDEHKPKVLQLVRDVGFEAFDFGKLDNARLLEPLALVWVRLAYQHGLGRDFALAVLRR